MRRTVKASANALDITITFNPIGDAPVTAMGLEEWLPPGWSFAEVVRGGAPSVLPRQGASGLLEFAWLSLPVNGGSFTYRVVASQDVAKLLAFYGEGLYRLRDVQDIARVPVITASAANGDSGDVASSPIAGAKSIPGDGDGSSRVETNGGANAAAVGSGGEDRASGTNASGAPTTTGLPISPISIMLMMVILAVLAAARIRHMKFRFFFLVLCAWMVLGMTPMAGADSVLTMTRATSLTGFYVPGQPLDVTIEMDLIGDGSLTATGVAETVPDGWTFDSVVSANVPGNEPTILPPSGWDWRCSISCGIRCR